MPENPKEAEYCYSNAMSWNGWNGNDYAGLAECNVLYGDDFNWDSEFQIMLKGLQKNEFNELEAKAAQGDVKAEVALAISYDQGCEVPKDFVKAAKWYRKAAEQGNPDAQYFLGDLYAEGRGVPQNDVQAYEWLSLSAANGGTNGPPAAQERDSVAQRMSRAEIVEGQIALAVSYEFGHVAPQDFVKAAKWYHEAAKQGDPGAQYFLGKLYVEGRGVPQNDVQAYVWLSLSAASDGGFALPAAQERDSVAYRMSRAEIVEGQQEAAAFVPKKDMPNSNPDGAASTDNPTATGSGFFITDDGYLVSNYHVVKDAVKVRLLTSGGLIPARVIQVDQADDIALLKADGNFSALPIAASRNVGLGATVATIGFPDPDLQGFAPKLAKGEIAALSGAQDDPRFFQISVPVQPGNSGGALVDGHGNVVGIVSAKLDAATALEASGALPENVNYAIKSSFLLSFLESVPGAEARLKKPNLADENFEDVVKSAQDATVMVLVY